MSHDKDFKLPALPAKLSPEDLAVEAELGIETVLREPEERAEYRYTAINRGYAAGQIAPADTVYTLDDDGYPEFDECPSYSQFCPSDRAELRYWWSIGYASALFYLHGTNGDVCEPYQ